MPPRPDPPFTKINWGFAFDVNAVSNHVGNAAVISLEVR